MGFSVLLFQASSPEESPSNRSKHCVHTLNAVYKQPELGQESPQRADRYFSPLVESQLPL